MAQSEINDYLKEIGKYPLLSVESELEAARMNFAGEGSGRDTLINANLRMVVKIHAEYMKRGMAPLDLIQEGTLGLIRAVESFDPKFAVQFRTYAAYWIKQSMCRASAHQGKAIRIPIVGRARIKKWKNAEDELEVKLGRKPRTDEVAEAMGYRKSRADRIVHMIATGKVEIY